MMKASKGLRFDKTDNGYAVVGIGTCTDADVVIPSTYRGLPVTSIGASAFHSCSRLTSINIPDSVTSIGYHAFDGCVNLTIQTPKGSYAEQYAKENGIKVELI